VKFGGIPHLKREMWGTYKPWEADKLQVLHFVKDDKA